MGLHLHLRLENTFARVGITHLWIDDPPSMADRPAGIVSLTHQINCFGGKVIPQQITPVIGDPQLVRAGSKNQSDGVTQTGGQKLFATTIWIIADNCSTARILLASNRGDVGTVASMSSVNARGSFPAAWASSSMKHCVAHTLPLSPGARQYPVGMPPRSLADRTCEP